MVKISTVSEVIILFRIRAGLSQQELSEKASIPGLELLNWEQGRSLPSEQQVRIIGEKLSLSPREINAFLLLANHSPANPHELNSSNPVIVDNYLLIPDSYLQQKRSFEEQVQMRDFQKTIEGLEERVRNILKEELLTVSKEVTNSKTEFAQLETDESPNRLKAYPIKGSPAVSFPNIDSGKLLKIVCRTLNLEDFKTLCFNLKPPYSYDDLEGEGKAAKARELILMLERRNDICKLLIELPRLNDTISWEDIL